MFFYSLILFLFCSSYSYAIYPLIFEKNRKKNCPKILYNSLNPQDIYFRSLRSEFKLEELIAQCKTELEKVLKITDWVHHLWQHNGDNTPSEPDALSILREVITEKKQFRCVEYSIVIAGCLNALGIKSRVLRLRTCDVETRPYGAGHVVVEAYLKSLGKWIMIDGQENCIPASCGKPLNAVEFQAALAKRRRSLQLLSCDKSVATRKALQEYRNFIEQYLYYFQTSLEQKPAYNRDQKSVMLGPIGAKKPEVFQIHTPFLNMCFTHSVNCFYKKPE